jgi:hypothetical protein
MAQKPGYIYRPGTVDMLGEFKLRTRFSEIHNGICLDEITPEDAPKGVTEEVTRAVQQIVVLKFDWAVLTDDLKNLFFTSHNVVSQNVTNGDVIEFIGKLVEVRFGDGFFHTFVFEVKNGTRAVLNGLETTTEG